MNRWLSHAAAVLVALLGGVYFGAFSCGGYAWHKDAFLLVLAATVTAALLVPLRRERPVLSRLLVLIAIPVLFVMTQAAATPFTPAAPDSVGDFLRGFVLALERGSC